MIPILCLLIAVNFLITLLVNALNLSYMGHPMPEEFARIWDKEKYARSQEYLKANSALKIINSFVISALTIVLLLQLTPVDHFIRSFSLGEVGSGLLFFALLILAGQLVSLPFSLYSTFVIEEKFGFNRTTAKTFIKDFVLDTALSLVIFSIIIGSILYLFTSYGPSAWIYCFLLFCVFALFLHYITPNWILPLFNRFSPIAEGPLKEAIQRYLDKQNFALGGVFSIDGSKRSNKVNAYFTGFGKTKRVALFDTLIANYSIDEIIAILAHEVGHCKRHHVEIGLCLALLGNGILFFLFSKFLVLAPSYYLGAFLFIVAFGAIAWIPTALQLALSRKHEYEADAFAKETADGNSMVSALLKLSADNLTNLTPHPLMVLLSYSHPPVIDRIHALQSSKT